MSVKIRLQRHGSKKRPFYFIVAANSTSPRDGKFIEKLGTYNPLTIPATVSIDRERALHWMNEGAQPTNTCRRILSFKGVLYLKHLMRGVSLGLFDEQAAQQKFEDWNGEHEQLVVNRDEAHRKHKADKRHAVVKDSVQKVEERMAARAAAAKPVEEEVPDTEEEGVVTEEVVASTDDTTTAETIEAEAPAAEEVIASTEDNTASGTKETEA